MASTESDLQTDLRKRARRRLLGAIALALTAAIVLPVVMDHEPRPPAQDIAVRIPPRESLPPLASPARVEPDEADAPALVPPPDSEPAAGGTRGASVPRSDASRPAVDAVTPPARPEPARTEGAKPDAAKPAPLRPEPAKAEAVRPDAGKADVPRSDPAKAQSARPGGEQKTETSATEAARAAAVLDGKASYALQLGVFSDAANVAKLRARAKELGFASFTEEVKLADGQTRTRVKVGPFSNRASAESAQRKLEAAGLRSMLSPRP